VKQKAEFQGINRDMYWARGDCRFQREVTGWLVMLLMIEM
jgi:hypothetical protein